MCPSSGCVLVYVYPASYQAASVTIPVRGHTVAVEVFNPSFSAMNSLPNLPVPVHYSSYSHHNQQNDYSNLRALCITLFHSKKAQE